MFRELAADHRADREAEAHRSRQPAVGDLALARHGDVAEMRGADLEDRHRRERREDAAERQEGRAVREREADERARIDDHARHDDARAAQAIRGKADGERDQQLREAADAC